VSSKNLRQLALLSDRELLILAAAMIYAGSPKISYEEAVNRARGIIDAEARRTEGASG